MTETAPGGRLLSIAVARNARIIDRRIVAVICVLIAAACPLAPGAAAKVPREKSLVARLTPAEKKAYDGLRYILSDRQKMEYLALRVERDREAWLEKYWLAADPTPTTDENEVRVEHETRVEAARRLFAAKDPPGWDRRGEILIRFGPPTVRQAEMGDVTTYGLTLPSEFWYYAALNMSVTFVDVNLKGWYTYATPQKTMKPPGYSVMLGRGPFEPPNIDYTADELVREMEMRTAPYQLAELQAMRGRKAEENFEIAMDRYAALYSCDTEWPPLPFSYDVASFRGGDWLDRTEVSFEVAARDSTLEAAGAGSGGEVEFRVLLRDKNMKKIASGTEIVTVPASRPDRPATAASGGGTDAGFVPAQIVLPLKPGHYEIGVEARDRRSNRRSARTGTIEVPAYTSSPCLSDIQLATSAEETAESARFLKGGLRVVPHPAHAYRKGAPLVFYFEIYNLRTDGEGIAQLKIEYKIEPLEKRRWGPVLQDVPTNVSSTFETSGYGSTQPQHLSIATEELWKGPFRLDVTVTDRATQRTATRSATFSIVE